MSAPTCAMEVLDVIDGAIDWTLSIPAHLWRELTRPRTLTDEQWLSGVIAQRAALGLPRHLTMTDHR